MQNVQMVLLMDLSKMKSNRNKQVIFTAGYKKKERVHNQDYFAKRLLPLWKMNVLGKCFVLTMIYFGLLLIRCL